jgi:hypothetical protein
MVKLREFRTSVFLSIIGGAVTFTLGPWKMDSIQEKALKMALSFIVCTSQKFSVFTSNRPARLMMFES